MGPAELMTRPLPWDSVLASLPKVVSETGKSVMVPLRLDNLAGEPVSSYQFTIEYNGDVVKPAQIAANLAGTLSEGLSLAYNSPSPGVLKVVV